MHLKIINRSKWPTPAITEIIRWLCRREHLGSAARPYEVIFNKATRYTCRSCGTEKNQQLWLHRRFVPGSGWPIRIDIASHRNSNVYTIRSRVELMVFTLAYQAQRAICTNHDDDLKKFGTHLANRVSPFDRPGFFAVQAFREAWPHLRHRIVIAMRRERKRQRQQRMKTQ